MDATEIYFYFKNFTENIQCAQSTNVQLVKGGKTFNFYFVCAHFVDVAFAVVVFVVEAVNAFNLFVPNVADNAHIHTQLIDVLF